MDKNSMIDKSYLAHIEFERLKSAENNLPSAYVNPDCIDAWRHDRMRDPIQPIIDFYPGSKWMTLGDGNFGSDAFYLQSKGLDATATSISDETISVAYQSGFIRKFKQMNAEQITEEENSYDFIFCKEAFHHFPRPFIALYEMIRVASKGVVLVEPQENRTRILDYIKHFIKLNIRKDKSLNYEPSGNFIYRVNIREMYKVLAAMNYRHLAYFKYNDFYAPSLSGYSKTGWNKGKILTTIAIGVQNLLCKLRLMDYGLAVVVLFKDEANSELLDRLRANGFTVETIPQNPYI